MVDAGGRQIMIRPETRVEGIPPALLREVYGQVTPDPRVEFLVLTFEYWLHGGATPGLQRALFFLMSPCLALLVAPREMRAGLFPALAGDVDGLVEDMMAYAGAGLDAIAAKYSASPRPPGG